METFVLLLRAINVGPRRLAMADLRALLVGAGLEDVRTHLQSGNAIVRADHAAEELAADARQRISAHCGFDVPVIVRSRAELDAVVARDPFGAVVTEPKLYWVAFLDRELPEAALERLRGRASDGEQVAVFGREIYASLPGGGGRSKVGTALGAPAREVLATARNWRVVCRLRDMAAEIEA